MKNDLHPQYHPNASIKCACGNEWKTGSVLESIELDVCSNCHPFYSGKEKHVDTQGRIERFEKRRKQHASVAESRTPKKARAKKQAAKA